MKKKLVIILITSVLFFSMLYIIKRDIPHIKDPDVNIAFTIDNNYPLYNMLVMDSILKNSKSTFKFYIVENNITLTNKLIMKLYMLLQPRANLVFIKVPDNLISHYSNLFSLSGFRITSIGMSRIMLPDLLPKSVHKVLYLDSDILVTTDIKDLYDVDLRGKPAGMVTNIKPGEYKFHNFKNYFNSGVILMDLDLWRKNRIYEKMLSYVENNKLLFMYDGQFNPDAFRYPDQDLINLILENEIYHLALFWNIQRQWFYEDVNDETRGIVHFVGKRKPWMNKSAKAPHELYNKYWYNSILVIFKPYHFYKNKCLYKKDIYRQLRINIYLKLIENFYMKLDMFFNKKD